MNSQLAGIRKPGQIFKEKIKMKKLLIGISVFLAALVIFGAGFAFAQTNTVNAAGLIAGYGPGGRMGGNGGMMGGRGQIHEYVEQALADKLGITKTDVETAEFSGKTMVQVATEHGIKEADVTAVLTEVHKTALAKAVTDGLLTQAQADTMLQNMTTNGFSFGNCQGPDGYQGGRGGRHGGMMGNWNVQPTPAP
jgi:hypothetical protein